MISAMRNNLPPHIRRSGYSHPRQDIFNWVLYTIAALGLLACAIAGGLF